MIMSDTMCITHPSLASGMKEIADGLPGHRLMKSVYGGVPSHDDHNLYRLISMCSKLLYYVMILVQK